jgi:hypothetical protein
LAYHENGVVKVPEAAGLGACIEDEYLSRFEKIVLQ